MVTIKKISWISSEIREAEVVITDGIYYLTCFSHPFELREGDELKESIYTLNESQVMRSFTNEFFIKKLDEPFAYYLIAQIVDVKTSLVRIGDIKITLHDMPKDLINGEFVEFYCDRLNIYCI